VEINGASNPENNGEFELKLPSQAAIDAVNAALEDISSRSFSARHP